MESDSTPVTPPSSSALLAEEAARLQESCSSSTSDPPLEFEPLCPEEDGGDTPVDEVTSITPSPTVSATASPLPEVRVTASTALVYICGLNFDRIVVP